MVTGVLELTGYDESLILYALKDARAGERASERVGEAHVVVYYIIDAIPFHRHRRRIAMR